MSVIERIVEQARKAKERKAAVLSAFRSLEASERREVLADLILEAEAEAQPTAERAPSTNGQPGQSGSFTDRAEAFVLAHPDGVTTRQVADAIGQDVSSVDGSLRNAMKRGRITRTGRLWVPVASAETAKTPKTTIRSLIERVFAEGDNKPLGAAALFEALKRFQPDINRSSVDGEMNRMRKDNLLIQVGVGPNGGGIYKLAKEADTTAQ